MKIILILIESILRKLDDTFWTVCIWNCVIFTRLDGHVVSGNVEHGILLVDGELLLPAAAQLLMSKLGVFNWRIFDGIFRGFSGSKKCIYWNL